MNEIKLFYFPPKRTCQCKQDEMDCWLRFEYRGYNCNNSILHFHTSCLPRKSRQTGQTQIRLLLKKQSGAGSSLFAFLTSITLTISSYSFLDHTNLAVM